MSINLRSTSVSNYQVPRMNKSVGQRSHSYLGPRTYNDLPNSIRSSKIADVQQTFKRAITRYNIIVLIQLSMYHVTCMQGPIMY